MAVGVLTGGSSSNEMLLFAAQTIKHKVMIILCILYVNTSLFKIVSDFVQCDEGTAVGLRDALWSLLFPSSVTRLSRPVQTQLSLALAALAAQCNEALWSDPIGMAAGQLDRHRSLVIQFLSHIPEQLANPLVSLPRSFYASQKTRLVDVQFDKMLALLVGQLGDPTCRKDVLGALHSWIKYGEAQEGVSSPVLLETAFKFIHMGLASDREILDDAAELACEVFYKIHQLEDVEGPEWLAILDQGLTSLWEPFQAALQANQADNEDDEAIETIRKLAMLYTESGSAFLHHFMTTGPSFQIVIESLLRSVESSDLETVQATFPFWEILSSRLMDRSEDDREPFVPVFSRLLRSAVHKHLVYPSGSITADQLDRFREFRHAVGDALKDCVRAMGSSEALSVIMDLFSHQTGQATGDGWQEMEAILFALRTIGSAVDRRESEILPRLFPSLLHLRSHPKLVYSVTLNIGCYADWLRYHPDLLPPTLEYVGAGFGSGEEECVRAAGMALKYLGESCGPLLVKFLPTLESLYQEMAIKASAGSKSVRLELSEAIGSILAALPSDDPSLPSHLDTCVSPWLAMLNGQRTVEALEHYRAIINTEDQTVSPALLSHFLSVAWPSISGLRLQTLSSSQDWDALLVCLRSILIAYGPSLSSDWDASLLSLLERVMQSGQLGAMYVLRAFILHASDERRALAWPSIHALLQATTTSLVSTPILPVDTSDYFGACTAVVDYYSMSPHEQLLLGCLGVVRAALSARPPVPQDAASAMQFLAHLLHQQLSDAHLPAMSHAILSSVSECIASALHSAMSVFPPDLIADIPPILIRIQSIQPGLPSNLLLALLSSLPSDSFVERERATWLQQFQAALVAPRANRELKDFLRTLAQACKRRLS